MTTIESPKYDWLRRGVRTFLQAFVATLMITLIPFLTDIVQSIISAKPYEFDFSAVQSFGLAASLAGFIALISSLHNALEDKAGVPAILKEKPSAGQNPVPDSSGPHGETV